MISVKNGDDVEVQINGQNLEILDVSDECTWAMCELAHFGDCLTNGFPENLALRIHEQTGFATYLFYEAELYREGDNTFVELICHHPNKYWEYTWGLSTLLGAMDKQLEYQEELIRGDLELDDDWKRFTVKFICDDNETIAKNIHEAASKAMILRRIAETSLGGMEWKPEYETNERLFCTDVLYPLLRRMGFLTVRYQHGTREYGKDFTFSELTPFNDLRHYGLQAKAGDVSGEVNGDIDILLGQIDDAFKIPYVELGSKDERYISTYIIAISGSFTSNAKEKIVQKTPKGLVGSVYFLDRDGILELISRHWTNK